MQPKIDLSCSPLAYPRHEMPATLSETFADETVSYRAVPERFVTPEADPSYNAGGASVAQDRQVEPAEARGVGE